MNAVANGAATATACGGASAMPSTSVHAKRREGKGRYLRGKRREVYGGERHHHGVAYATREAGDAMMTATRQGIAS